MLIPLSDLGASRPLSLPPLSCLRIALEAAERENPPVRKGGTCSLAAVTEPVTVVENQLLGCNFCLQEGFQLA